MIQPPPPPLPLSWPWAIKINVTPFANGTFQPTQAGDASSVSATLHMWTAHDTADQLCFTPLYHFHQRVQSSFCFRNSQECQFSSWGSSSRSWQHVQHFNAWSRSTDSTTALPSAIMANFSTTWTPGLTPSRFVFRHCYFPKYPLDPVVIVQELCESRGGRPGLSVLTSLLVSVDVKIYCTVLRHWSQLVPNMSHDIWGH